MNKPAIVSSIISGVVGLAIGGGSVFLYYKKIHENVMSELESSRETVRDLQNKINVRSEDIKADLIKQISIPSKNDYKDAVESIDNKPAEESTEDSATIDISEDLPNADESGNIRFIGPQDYDDDDDYEKEKIKFYSKDGVLTQDDDILSLEEFEDVCGKKALTSFGRYGAGANACYVRNEEYMTDYEIKRYNMSYQSYKNGLK
jgi:hypothetical protein